MSLPPPALAYLCAPTQTINSFYYLALNVVVYGVLTWYFDNVISGEHGATLPFYFPFTRSYWGCGSKRRTGRDDDGGAQPAGRDLALADEDVEAEYARAHAAYGTDDPINDGVVIRDLAKTYHKSVFCETKDDVRALKGVSLTVPRGSILCLLGLAKCFVFDGPVCCAMCDVR